MGCCCSSRNVPEDKDFKRPVASSEDLTVAELAEEAFSAAPGRVAPAYNAPRSKSLFTRATSPFVEGAAGIYKRFSLPAWTTTPKSVKSVTTDGGRTYTISPDDKASVYSPPPYGSDTSKHGTRYRRQSHSYAPSKAPFSQASNTRSPPPGSYPQREETPPPPGQRERRGTFTTGESKAPFFGQYAEPTLTESFPQREETPQPPGRRERRGTFTMGESKAPFSQQYEEPPSYWQPPDTDTGMSRYKKSSHAFMPSQTPFAPVEPSPYRQPSDTDTGIASGIRYRRDSHSVMPSQPPFLYNENQSNTAESPTKGSRYRRGSHSMIPSEPPDFRQTYDVQHPTPKRDTPRRESRYRRDSHYLVQSVTPDPSLKHIESPPHKKPCGINSILNVQSFIPSASLLQPSSAEVASAGSIYSPEPSPKVSLEDFAKPESVSPYHSQAPPVIVQDPDNDHESGSGYRRDFHCAMPSERPFPEASRPPYLPQQMSYEVKSRIFDMPGWDLPEMPSKW